LELICRQSKQVTIQLKRNFPNETNYSFTTRRFEKKGKKERKENTTIITITMIILITIMIMIMITIIVIIKTRWNRIVEIIYSSWRWGRNPNRKVTFEDVGRGKSWKIRTLDSGPKSS